MVAAQGFLFFKKEPKCCNKSLKLKNTKKIQHNSTQVQLQCYSYPLPSKLLPQPALHHSYASLHLKPGH